MTQDRSNYIKITVICLLSTSIAWSQSFQINELMASNRSTLTDPQGEYDDWIELVNANRVYEDLAGMYLSDDADDLTQWQFPTDAPSLTEVAPGGFVLVWADKDDAHGLHASFKLSADGEALYLTDTDGVTVLDSIAFGVQDADISYGRNLDDPSIWQIMGTPTPGLPNVTGFLGAIDSPAFNHERGFYEESFQLTLTTSPLDASILYTLDSSTPEIDDQSQIVNGKLYDSPLEITQTCCVRALAFKPGYLTSEVVTQTYLFADQILSQSGSPDGFPSSWSGTTADYQMNIEMRGFEDKRPEYLEALQSLPTLSLVMNVDDWFGSQGIYANPVEAGIDWERAVSAEFMDVNGLTDFQVNCGIRIQGGYFRSNSMSRKHSFRLLFKGDYGPTRLEVPLFGPEAAQGFETLTLRAGANDGYAWSGADTTVQYTRDEFGRRLQLAAGHASSHGIFVNLYVNGLYWGLYNLVERPDNAFSADYYGGEREKWDALHEGGYGDNSGIEATNGDFEAWDTMVATCQLASDSYETYQALQGRDVNGLPDANELNLLDLPNYIDYLLINLWGGNWDWPWKNYWVGRDRTANSTGFKFYNWDYENTMGNNRSCSPLNKNALNNSFEDVGEPHVWLRGNPEYRLFFADRIQAMLFHDGLLTPNSLIPRYEEICATIEPAMLLESARWGDMHYSNALTREDWIQERDWILETFLPQRTTIVLDQFIDAGLYPEIVAPELQVDGQMQQGGYVPYNSLLSLIAEEGQIWYTLDGSDPHLPEAALGNSDQIDELVADRMDKFVWIPTEDIGDSWRTDVTFDDQTWLHGRGGIGYDIGSGYEDYFTFDVANEMYGGQNSCYVRIPFTVEPSELTTLILAVRYDDAFVAYLNGQEIARANVNGDVQWNSQADTQHSDSEAVQWQEFDVSDFLGKLSEGQNLLALQGLNLNSGSSDFLLDARLWLQEQNSGGALVSTTAQAYEEPLQLSTTTHIKARTYHEGQWSALTEAVYAIESVADGLRLVEIMYHPLDTGHPNDPNTEFLEFTNIGTEPIPLQGITLSQGVDFTFGDMTLEPGACVMVVRDQDAFVDRYGSPLDVAGHYTGALSNGGERLVLNDALGQVLLDFTYQDSWYPSTDGDGYSLEIADPYGDLQDWNRATGWQSSTQLGGTPGQNE